ncbi:hypothetical protein HYPSUDRAFT_467151 [Hypholoma sublateritium FD-334 SS-4]|uniref:Uncharacterized protein n=1 Tax=Hypholoma sublateritium (strain FD-334 SS-4) TaxID=945553 RepID=A0A0D2NBS6_HYPSF|nr:hypothetical protein HYPSUDRAFT_467151 [Hypholoma sublateritium FD-334 SS-4]
MPMDLRGIYKYKNEMPPSPTHSPKPNARSVTLPSYAEFVAAYYPKRDIHHTVIHVPLCVATSHAAPAPIQRTPTGYHRPGAHPASITKDMAAGRVTLPEPAQFVPAEYQVFIPIPDVPGKDMVVVHLHLRSPAVACRLPLPLPPALKDDPHIVGAMIAHARRFRTFGLDPALRRPSAQDIEIDLCRVDCAYSVRATGAHFYRSARALMPRAVGGRWEYELEWDILCAHCGALVPHGEADKVWNGRFLKHRRECDARCAVARQVGEAAMWGHQCGSGAA